MRNLKIHPKFKEKFKIKKGLRKMAKLDRMNTRLQRGAVEITLDLFKGLSQETLRETHIQLVLWKLH